MGHRTRLTLAGSLACLLLLSSYCEANAHAESCKVGCHGIHVNRAYQEGQTYTYQLEGTSVTSVSEAQGEARLKLSATVELAVQPHCTHQLRLKNVKVNNAPVHVRDVEQHVLQFNYHNGHVDSEVCAASGDSQASLNIKRAVVSLFQAAVIQESGATTHHETDVFGGCPTDFSFHKDGDSQVVRKFRNLGQCSYRENIKHDLISSVFNPNSEIKSTPLLDAEQTVEQHFRRGVLGKAVSTETYKYKPFSNGEAGAKTIVETVLTLKGQKGSGSPAPAVLPKSLIFEAPHLVVSSSQDKIFEALKASKDSVHDGVTPFTARRFTELVKVLRHSSKNDILSIYAKVKAGAGFDRVADRKVLLDALFRAGTGEAAEAAVELIRNRELHGIETYVYYASLALMRHATLPSVTAAASLLDQSGLPRIGFLGIGSLIGKFCAEHNCENVPEVKNALNKLISKVGSGKANTRAKEDVIISALKTLGNAKYLDDANLQKIARIAANKGINNRVRVAAIEALPTRCSMKWKTLVFPTLADREEDSEIRIKTYLALVACPCSHVANHLKEVLDKETINQVGSFITSHLRNLRASADPNKQNAKNQLGLIKPRTKFPEDIRKFSFNNELSYAIDAFGVGSSGESNVIYSQNSFFPRSVSLNLTTEVFGHSFNFLELNGRAENVDKLIEHYLGPKGFFHTSDVDDVVGKGKKTFDDIANRIKARLQRTIRGRRHVAQSDLDNFAKHVELRDNEVNDEVDIDLSLKLFGAELLFLSYQGAGPKTTPQAVLEDIFNVIDAGIDKAKNFDLHHEHHLQFLDAELVYPTGLGFPLSLGVTGSSAVHVKTKGNIDIPAIIKNPESAEVKFALEPSASIRIAGSLIVESFGVESGLKVISTLHTSTAGDISVKLLKGKGIDVNFGIPKRKQEIISISSEVLISSGANGDNYVSPKFTKGNVQSDCFDQLSVLLGVTACYTIAYPYDSLASIQKKPLFPLSGPAKFGLSFENNDVKSYHFKAYYNADNPSSRSFEIVLETPNSKTDRRVSLLLEGSVAPDHRLKISLDSPIKKASIEGVIKSNAQESTISVTVLNDRNEYYARAGIRANGAKYAPILEYRVPEQIEKLAPFKGGVKTSRRNGQQYSVAGVVEVANINNGKKYVFDNVALISDGQKFINIDGFVTGGPSSATSDLRISYARESLALKLDAQRLGNLHYKGSLSVVPEKDPEIGFSVKWEYQRDKNHVENNLVVVHGRDLNSETNRFSLNQYFNYKYESSGSFDISAKQKLTYPVRGIVVKLEGAATRKSFSYDLELKYDKFEVGSELSAKTGIAKTGDYEIEFEANVLKNSIEIKSKREILDEFKSKFENSLEVKPGGKYELDATIVHNVKPNDIDLKLDAQLKANQKKIKIDTGLLFNAQKIDSVAVISVDNTKYIDFILKAHRGNNPSGNIKLNIKNYLTAAGHLKYQNGRGDAEIDINFTKVNRKIVGKGDIAITGTRHVATVELLYDAARDQNKRIKLYTNTDFTQSLFDTKNVLEILSYKTEFNAKGSLQGKVTDGRINGNFDLTLPNGRYVVGKFNRDLIRKGETMEANAAFELVDFVTKGGRSRKVIYKAEGHNVNPKTSTFQTKNSLQFISFDGKDVALAVALENSPKNGDRKIGQVDVALTGSLLPKPFTLLVWSDYSLDDSTWKISSSIGSDLDVKGSGSCAYGDKANKPKTINAVIDVKLPSEKLQNIKLEVSESILVPVEIGGLFEYIKSLTFTYNNNKRVKLDAHAKHTGIDSNEHASEGSGGVTFTLFNNEPLAIATSYKHNPTEEIKQSSVSLNVNYGEKEASLAVDSSYLLDLSSVDLNLKATTPADNLRRVDLKLNHKREQEGKLRKTDVVVIADDKRYTMNSEIQISEVSPSIKVIITNPSGKTELFSKVNKLSEKEFTGEWKLDSPKGFVTLDGHVDLENVDNFYITFNLDSDNLKQRKIHGEIANKPAKTGKRITIIITSEGKNIVTGSTNYKKHEENGKVVVEGSGSLKIGSNTKSSTFKYSRHQLSQDADGETGVAIALNSNFGPSAVVGELKWTNKEVHILNSYCEQSKDCAHFELQSKLIANGASDLDHQITVEVDLKKFNVPVEFALKTSTKRQGITLDHLVSLYLHSSRENTQYSYQVYVHPKESAIILTLPSRELAIIGSADVPRNRRAGAYKVDVSVYLDRKNNPKDKTTLAISGNAAIDKNAGSVNGEARFTFPSQARDLTVNGKLHYGGSSLLDAHLDVDVFAKKDQKISVSAKLVNVKLPRGYNVTGTLAVNSRGQHLTVGIDEHFAISANEIGFGSLLSYTDEHRKPKSTGVLFSLTPQRAHLLVQSPNKQLVKADSIIDIKKDVQKINTEYTLLNQHPVVSSLEIHNLNRFTYQYQVKSVENSKVVANGRFVIGEIAEVHADAFANGGKRELFHVSIHLDDRRFLKPDFSYDKANIAKVINVYHERATDFLKQLKDFVKDLGEEVITELKDLLEHLNKAQPNLKPLLQHYQAELDKLKKELHADQTIKEIQATLNKLFGGPIAAIVETLKKIAERTEELSKQLTEIVNKIAEAIKAAYPQVKKSYDRIIQIGSEIVESFVNFGFAQVNIILDIVNEHQAEFKQLAIITSDLLQDVVKIILKGIDEVQGEVKSFFTLFIEQVKALPIYNLLETKYKEIANFQLPETIIASIGDIVNAIKQTLPTPELKQLLTTAYDYVVKHIRRQKVDEVTELKNLYARTLNAIQSIINLIQSRATTDNVIDLLDAHLPFDIRILSKIPGILSLKLSVFTLLRNRDLPSPVDLYYAYRPTAKLEDFLPPFSMSATFTNGGHFFTFDGRHLTLPGKCDYVLAQDIRDGNFSIVATLNDGNLESFTVTEPGASITIKATGGILVNGRPAEYPASTNNLHAFLTVPLLNVVSDYGVHLVCGEKGLTVCTVTVSGFYLGRLRGLLGDGNNEPFDDFTLPNGKISEKESEFGNAYKLKSGCPNVQAVDHHHVQREAVCTEYFTSGSRMSGCFNYVNPNSYRTACDHAVSARTADAACLISISYVIACHHEGIFINTPPTCGSCQVGNKKVDIGDTFSVKIPKQQADIIFVVEQVTENQKVFKDLVTPLITVIKTDLKEHGITDVNIGIIGFGEKLPGPAHYTTGGLRSIDGEVKNINFEGKVSTITFEEAKKGGIDERIRFVKKVLGVELGLTKRKDAFVAAVGYSFRPGSAKVIIGVLASPCEKSSLPLSLQQLTKLIYLKKFRDQGIIYNHIAPLEDLKASGKAVRNIVGFDSDAAYIFADSKRRPIVGNAELRNSLELPNNDICADFAAATGGALFSSHNFLDAKAPQKKQYIQVAARRVVDNIINVELEEDCKCGQFLGVFGRAECTIVGRKEKEPLVRRTKGGVKA